MDVIMYNMTFKATHEFNVESWASEATSRGQPTSAEER